MAPISVLLLSSLSAAFILISATSVKPIPDPKDCGDDREFNGCGSACPPNCTHPDGVACKKICSAGCFCKEGFVELDEFTCVEKKKCESCTGNTTYTTGDTTCPNTCSNRFNKPELCTLQSIERCKCKPGFVFLDKELTKCVLPEDCPED